MLHVEDRLNFLSAQYLLHCQDTNNVCHHIITMDHLPRGNERDTLHQTQPNRVTVAIKHQERYTPDNSNLMCQYINRQYDG